MSPLMILGSLGTILSTTAMLPHLAHALRNRRPSGSTTGWLVGALSSTIWFAYGIDRHDLLQAAPGFVTVPAGVFLTGWCLLTAHRSHRRPGAQNLTVLAGSDVPVLTAPEPVTDLFAPAAAPRRDPGDTLELPRISA